MGLKPQSHGYQVERRRISALYHSQNFNGEYNLKSYIFVSYNTNIPKNLSDFKFSQVFKSIY